MEITIDRYAVMWAKIHRAASKATLQMADEVADEAGRILSVGADDNRVRIVVYKEEALSRHLEFARAMEAEGLTVSVKLDFEPSEASHALLRLLNLQAIIA